MPQKDMTNIPKDLLLTDCLAVPFSPRIQIYTVEKRAPKFTELYVIAVGIDISFMVSLKDLDFRYILLSNKGS